MAGNTYSSAKTGLSAALQRLFDQETSFARRFSKADEQNSSFYNHMDCIARAARRLDNISSTGVVATLQHAPWRSTKSQCSSAEVQSSAGMRLVIRSSGIGGDVKASWAIAKSKFGLSKIIAVQAQIASTRTAWAANQYHPCTLVTRILPSNSTVVVTPYAPTFKIMTASTSYTLTPASGMAICTSTTPANCWVHVFAYGY